MIPSQPDYYFNIHSLLSLGCSKRMLILLILINPLSLILLDHLRLPPPPPHPQPKDDFASYYSSFCQTNTIWLPFAVMYVHEAGTHVLVPTKDSLLCVKDR